MYYTKHCGFIVKKKLYIKSDFRLQFFMYTAFSGEPSNKQYYLVILVICSHISVVSISSVSVIYEVFVSMDLASRCLFPSQHQHAPTRTLDLVFSTDPASEPTVKREGRCCSWERSFLNGSSLV